MGIHRAVPAPRRRFGASLGVPGLGRARQRASARTRAHTRTDTHTHPSSGGESPLFVAVRPQPVRDPQVLAGAIAQAWGWNQEGHPTPHTWHIGICPRASLRPWRSQRPAGRATERSWVRTERRQRGNEVGGVISFQKGAGSQALRSPYQAGSGPSFLTMSGRRSWGVGVGEKGLFSGNGRTSAKLILNGKRAATEWGWGVVLPSWPQKSPYFFIQASATP